MKPDMRPLWFKRFLAWYRWDLDLVCELSKDKGPFNDYHDYPDDPQGQPWHWTKLKCKRCGKGFYI